MSEDHLKISDDGAYRFNNGLAPAPSADGIVEEFEKLGGDDDLLQHVDDDAPPMCRPYQWPESPFELDPDKVKDFIRAALARHGDARYEEGKRDGLKVAVERLEALAGVNGNKFGVSGMLDICASSLRAAAREDGIALD
jgi:hypothetical protein